MQIIAETPEHYFSQLPEDKRLVMIKLRQAILESLPKGFEEVMNYGMIGYVVPYSLYPAGYHCKPRQPLPFLNIAAQKNFIAVYHMGIYGSKDLLDWFTTEYPKHCSAKLDMGKGCIRFKKLDEVPYALIGELSSKITVAEWIKMYDIQREKQNLLK